MDNISTTASPANYTSGSLNETETAEELLIPRPLWRNAKLQWGIVWELHVYGLAAFYLSLTITSFVILLLMKKRALVLRHLLPLGIMLILFGTLRSCYFLIDPYQSENRMPEDIGMCIFALAFPCLCYAYSVVIYVLMRITRVQVGSKCACQHTTTLVLTTAYFVVILAINMVVSYYWYLKLLLLIPQVAFITWMLLLCFTFIYGGFKMTQFSKDSEAILRQISTMKRLRQEPVSEGNKMLHFLQRIRRPKLHLVAEEEASMTYGSESSISGSESLLYLNEAYFDSDVNSCPPNDNKQPNSLCTAQKPVNSSSNKTANGQSDNRLIRSNSSSKVHHPKDPLIKTVNGTCDGPALQVLRQNGNSSGKHKISATSTEGQEVKGSKGQSETNAVQTSSTFHFAEISVTSSESEGEKAESGYLADTEVHSPGRQRKHYKRHAPTTSSTDNQSNKEKDYSPEHKHELPPGGATVSLCRIRQGRVLQRVLRVTYLSTLMAFTCCVLQLYSMFGVYGVLSHVAHPDPWQWLMFKTIFRLTELGLTFTMCLAMYYLGRGRERKRRKPHKQLVQEKATVC